MKKRDDLFHLIKAMSKSEKRYFTLDAKKSSSKGSKYLVLFQAVNDMEIYDEAKLKKKFGKNLRYDKSYLYEAIMRSMRDYRSANSYAARIKEMILDAQYLYERSLYEQCGERLEEAKELAVVLDDQLSLLEINKAERLLVRQTKGRNYAIKMKGLLKQTEVHLGYLSGELEYLDLLDRLVLEIDRRFELKGKKELEEFNAMFPSRIFTESERLQSPRTLLRFYQCSAFYSQLLRNNEELLMNYTKIVQWWDENKKIKEEEFHRYIIDVSTLLQAYSNIGSYHKIPELTSRLEEGTPKNQHDQGIVFQKTIIYKLLYYINTGSSSGVEELVDDVRAGLGRFQVKESTKNVIIFNTSVMLFLQGKFQQCVDWNTRIISGKKYLTRRDIRNGVILLNLIAIYELEDDDRFETFQRSAGRFFSKQKSPNINQFETAVILFLRMLFSSPSAEQTDIFRLFSTKLTELKNDPDVKISLGLDELLQLWIKSKIQKESMITQIREQYEKTVA